MNCFAHWSEGTTNYLVGRISSQNQKPSYKCLVYTELNRPDVNKNLNRRYNYDANGVSSEDFVELAQMQNSNNENRYETIQVTISQDEFCRNIDNIIEDQYTLTFAKCELDTIIILISIKSIFMTFKQMYQKQI